MGLVLAHHYRSKVEAIGCRYSSIEWLDGSRLRVFARQLSVLVGCSVVVGRWRGVVVVIKLLDLAQVVWGFATHSDEEVEVLVDQQVSWIESTAVLARVVSVSLEPRPVHWFWSVVWTRLHLADQAILLAKAFSAHQLDVDHADLDSGRDAVLDDATDDDLDDDLDADHELTMLVHLYPE